jgi:hypothetical protein
MKDMIVISQAYNNVKEKDPQSIGSFKKRI